MDFPQLSQSIELLEKLKDRVGLAKVGSQLFTAEGPEAVRQVSRLVSGIFLDLKFCDIPNTVAGAVSAAAELPAIKMLTLHAMGGSAMMKAAAESLRGRRNSPKLLAVTVLTSLDEEQIRCVGLQGPVQARVEVLAALAKESGMGGVVASPQEIGIVRHVVGEGMSIVVPGIRPSGSAAADQSRVATPEAAIRARADYIVVGRPITAARDPVQAADAILDEIRRARS